jgi:hypothetical protein
MRMRNLASLGLVIAILLPGCVSGPREGLASLQQHAEGGDAVAQRRLGSRFDFGYGVRQNYAEAARWYQMAADQGDAAAQNNLGSLYQYGLGVSTNLSKALELYRKSADQGFAMAENNLGFMHDSGLGVAQDREQANKWFRRAAEQGYADAMYNLGVNCGGGFGVQQDLAEAYKWVDLARFYTQFGPNVKIKWTIRHAWDDLERQLPKEVLAEGRRRAKEWRHSHPPDKKD